MGQFLHTLFSSTDKMKGLFLSAVSLAFVSGVPSVKREADPLLYAAGPVVHRAPLLYHAPNCTSVDGTLTTKQCLPKEEEAAAEVVKREANPQLVYGLPYLVPVPQYKY